MKSRGYALLAAAALPFAACSWFSSSSSSNLPTVAVPGAIASASFAAGSASAPPEPPPPPLVLKVHAPKETNRGGPLYLIVRKTSDSAFLAEDYAHVADDVFPGTSGAVIAKAVIWPGRDSSLVVRRSDKTTLGIYFMFSAPQDNKWRLMLNDPCTTQIDLDLGADSVRSFQASGAC